MRNLTFGAIVAVVIAAVMADAAVFGIALWKIVLAVIGLALFVGGGRASGGANR